jgi:hypothetical protein
MVLGFREREARPMSREVVVVMGRRAASVENWRGGRREMGEGGDRERRKRERERRGESAWGEVEERRVVGVVGGADASREIKLIEMKFWVRES